MDPKTPEQRRLVRRLFQRRAEGILVPFEPVQVADWRPAQHCCHDNVRRWVEVRPDLKIVRGWLFFEIMLPDMCPQFVAHSVAEKQDGTLVDVTPSGASRPYPFIRHMGATVDFDRLVDEWSIVRLNYRG
jgi:hypothetical protein